MRMSLAVLIGVFGCALLAFSLASGAFPASSVPAMPWLAALQGYGPFVAVILLLLGGLVALRSARLARQQDAQDAAESQYVTAYAQARALWRQGQREASIAMLETLAPYYEPAAQALQRIHVAE